MNIHIYKSHNGLWRMSIDGKVHPLLVGFTDLGDLLKKFTQLIAPDTNLTTTKE